jgi:hypothetical protein
MLRLSETGAPVAWVRRCAVGFSLIVLAPGYRGSQRRGFIDLGRGDRGFFKAQAVDVLNEVAILLFIVDPALYVTLRLTGSDSFGVQLGRLDNKSLRSYLCWMKSKAQWSSDGSVQNVGG